MTGCCYDGINITGWYPTAHESKLTISLAGEEGDGLTLRVSLLLGTGV